jgi:hypothetical protein
MTTHVDAASVRKSPGHDIIHAPTDDLDAHRARLREAFGGTQSDQFVETMMGKLISGLRPNPFDVLEEAIERRLGRDCFSQTLL